MPSPSPPGSPQQTTRLKPRLHLFNAKGKRLAVPGAQERDGQMFYCSSCWEEADHTMIWCITCNKHLHGMCFENPEEAEKLHLGEGWVCDECF